MEKLDLLEYYNRFKTKLIGEGAYANVYKYKDEFYNMNFAVKKLKNNVTDKEKARFEHEYKLLSTYDFPHILKAHCYIQSENAYIMDYCEYTLRKYLESNGNNLDFNLRKNIAIQFLEAMQFVHSKGILHRDISFNNILIKENDSLLPLVKVSDFGLVKDESLDLTSTNSIIRGTIIDDTLKSFKDYNIKNEIYNIGYIIHYIFTGRQNLSFKEDNSIMQIVKKCVDREHNKRYNSVTEIIIDIKNANEGKEVGDSLYIDSNGNIKVNSNFTHDNVLNELAIEILKDAVDSNGEIRYLRNLSGLTIQSGNKSYKPNNAREEAELEDVIEKLEINEFIKAMSYKRQIFKVTKKGYDYFETEYIYV